MAREPGYRSKIAVVSHAGGVDPVGACVGPRGSRVRMVVSELRGEKIDIIPFNEEPARFVAKALSPARVREVLVDDENKQATVIVPDDQLSLAIGKEGQNARLAARLTGWRVDIRSETEFAKEEAEHGYQEEEVAGRCAAIMSTGRRCPNAALPGSRYCGLPAHQALADAGTDKVAEANGDAPEAEEAEEQVAEEQVTEEAQAEEPVAEVADEEPVAEPADEEPAAETDDAPEARGRRRPRDGGGTGVVGAVPHRRCVGCGRSLPKPELVRFVLGPSGIERDAEALRPGRGAYLCPRPPCAEKALGTNGFQRSFRGPIRVPKETIDFTR